MTMGTHILHYPQLKTQSPDSWLVNKWLTLSFHLCEKNGITFSSPYFSTEALAVGATKRWVEPHHPKQPHQLWAESHKMKVINKLEPTSKCENLTEFLQHSLILIIDVQMVNISISKSPKWFKNEKLIQIPNVTLINTESWHWYHSQWVVDSKLILHPQCILPFLPPSWH